MLRLNVARQEAVTGLDGTGEDEEAIPQSLIRLQQEHRDLDHAIHALETAPVVDALQIRRLKKKKLTLKDRISHLEDKLTPDIIA